MMPTNSRQRQNEWANEKFVEKTAQKKMCRKSRNVTIEMTVFFAAVFVDERQRKCLIP